MLIKETSKKNYVQKIKTIHKDITLLEETRFHNIQAYQSDIQKLYKKFQKVLFEVLEKNFVDIIKEVKIFEIVD